MTDAWLLVDAPCLCWRAYYGAGDRHPVASVLASVVDVHRLCEKFAAPNVVWAFDRKPYRRKSLYPDYKSTRDARKVSDEDAADKDALRSQMDRLRTDYLPALGYGNVVSAPGFEADDLLAAAVAALPGRELTVVTEDQDLYQVMGPRTSVYHPRANLLVTPKWLRTRFGLHPSQWREAKAIAGCSSDDVPGVDGVAMETASRYLCGDDVTPARLRAIEAYVGSDAHALGTELVTLPLSGCPAVEPVPDPDPCPADAWERLCRRLDVPGLLSAVRTRPVRACVDYVGEGS